MSRACHVAFAAQAKASHSACGDGGWFVGDSDGGEACGASASALCINMKDPANPDNCMYLAAEVSLPSLRQFARERTLTRIFRSGRLRVA